MSLSICKRICFTCQKEEQKFQGIESDGFICLVNYPFWFESFSVNLLKGPEFERNKEMKVKLGKPVLHCIKVT